MTDAIENWSGEIVREERRVEYLEWVWADAKCKKQSRYVVTFRKFFTKPKPPVTDIHFMVRPQGENSAIECYSTVECLIPFVSEKKLEERFF